MLVMSDQECCEVFTILVAIEKNLGSVDVTAKGGRGFQAFSLKKNTPQTLINIGFRFKNGHFCIVIF